jgi:TetR/AcrR family transcriptional regulator, ethionamide resistance regulator
VVETPPLTRRQLRAAQPPRRQPEGSRDVRRAILDSTERLLSERRFDAITVADVLAAADVSRASFYFYFANKNAVLAELVRAAVGSAHDTAQPWLEPPGDRTPTERLREGTTAGARLWRDKAPVLRAIVENWGTDDELTQLWVDLMASFTAATIERIETDPGASEVLAEHTSAGLRSLASALTWLDERLFYLAAIGVAPFDDEKQLIDVLTEVWVSVIYGRDPATSAKRRRASKAPSGH